jgi:uncharacterized protein (TIGR00251 family)
MLIDVRVVPSSPSFAIVSKDGIVKIYVTEKAENNKANIEIIKKLEKLTGAPVRIVSGLTSSHKKIEIEIAKEKWEQLLNRFDSNSKK